MLLEQEEIHPTSVSASLHLDWLCGLDEVLDELEILVIVF